MAQLSPTRCRFRLGRRPSAQRLLIGGLGLAVAATGAVSTQLAAQAGPHAPDEPAAVSGFVRVPDPVPGSYLVVLKGQTGPGAAFKTAAGNAARSLVATAGGRLGTVYSAALKGFAFSGTEAQARALAADPSVQFVQENGRVTIADTQTNPPSWGLDRIDQRNLPLNQAYTYPTTASSVHVYVLDTGIRASHQTFGGRADVVFDNVGDGRNGVDCHGHGTHVAGTVGGSAYGVAKAVRIHAVRVLNCSGSGDDNKIAAAIDWVAQNAQRPAVANMSLGAQGSHAGMEQAVRGAIAAGVTFVLAGGNNNESACNFTPAREPLAITVGATEQNDAKASFSNFGSCLDIWAPGSGIVSAGISSDTATATMSGTSMASPHVTGAAAVFLALNPAATPQQIRDALVNNATPGKVTNPGSGSPNLLLFLTGTPTSPSPSPSASTPPASPSPSPPPSSPSPSTPPSSPPPPGSTFSNETDFVIGDFNRPALSPITVTGRSGSAASNLTRWHEEIAPPATTAFGGPGAIPAGRADISVAVRIACPNRGQLQIDLIGPNGFTYLLKQINFADTAPNVDTIYTVNASASPANGTWQLRVRAFNFTANNGILDRWSLSF